MPRDQLLKQAIEQLNYNSIILFLFSGLALKLMFTTTVTLICFIQSPQKQFIVPFLTELSYSF